MELNLFLGEWCQVGTAQEIFRIEEIGRIGELLQQIAHSRKIRW